MKISAVILAKNEASTIERAIMSVVFCDEVIVIDDNSTDSTEQIAKKKHAVVIKRDLNDDYADQRNFGLKAATSDWVLFIDADEEVMPELAEEIQKTILQNDILVFYLRRRDFWWGKELKHGETSKVRNTGLLRLMKKESGTWKGKVHEEFRTSYKTVRLKGFINHYPHPTLKDFLQDINRYSTLRAKQLKNENKSVTTFSIIIYPLSKFILTYFIKLGFLDGPAGFAYAFIMSFHSFLVRAKLYQYLHFNEK